MENLQKMKDLIKVNYNDKSALQEFYKEFETLTEEEKLVVVNYLMEHYDYNEDMEQDDKAALSFLKSEKFDPQMKVFYEIINNDTPENQAKLDKICEETALLETEENVQE